MQAPHLACVYIRYYKGVGEFNATAVYTADAAAFKGYTKSVVVSTPSTGGVGHGRTVARAASRAPHRIPVVVVFGDRMAELLQYLSTQFLPREITILPLIRCRFYS